ncbi:hypothetical protein [Streptomyces sp. NPDC005485]|uniref:hypothetical protein n=1 Tax=Streptomyces sp. NPDC005485 TaxID=3155591 RepID=UPI0033B9A1F6
MSPLVAEGQSAGEFGVAPTGDAGEFVMGAQFGLGGLQHPGVGAQRGGVVVGLLLPMAQVAQEVERGLGAALLFRRAVHLPITVYGLLAPSRPAVPVGELVAGEAGVLVVWPLEALTVGQELREQLHGAFRIAGLPCPVGELVPQGQGGEVVGPGGGRRLDDQFAIALHGLAGSALPAVLLGRGAAVPQPGEHIRRRFAGRRRGVPSLADPSHTDPPELQIGRHPAPHGDRMKSP